MKIRCLVVDDEPLAREGISGYVGQVPYLELVQTCKNAMEATEVLQSEQIDLVFLDIHMPGMSGLQLAKSLNDAPGIIFTTAYRDYAADGFDVNAIDYLLKPISFERFVQGSNKAYEHFISRQAVELAPGTQDEFFFVKCDGKYVKVFLNEILFIEGMKDYTIIHRGDEKLIVLVSLGKVAENLDPADFIRVHKSYIVSKAKVEAIEGNQLKMGSYNVPISKGMKDSVINSIIGDKLWKRA